MGMEKLKPFLDVNYKEGEAEKFVFIRRRVSRSRVAILISAGVRS
jgi:hypothetical protein